MPIVSSDDLAWRSIGADDQVVFSMFQSATAAKNRKHIQRFIRQAGELGVFVVIDEAHHACAPTWVKLVKELKNHVAGLIGLTATPMRTVEHENRQLWALFDNHIITRVAKQTLIDEGILATPYPEKVETHVELEGDMEKEQQRLFNKFGDLSDYVLQRLAKSSIRNKQIVKHYKANRSRFGKTIVFAIDTFHGRTLHQEFKSAGISVDYVDYTKNNDTTIERYRTAPDPEVLINVMILTEGFDAPCTRTVFITRPTKSEVLVQQMIGRALRGPAAKGNEKAYLVSFVDTWKTFNPIEPEIILLQEAVAEAAARNPVKLNAPINVSASVHEEIILAVYNMLRRKTAGEITAIHSSLPHSWYSWTVCSDDDIFHKRVLVYEHQWVAFDKLIAYYRKNLAELPKGELSSAFCIEVRDRFFHDLPDPLPTWADLRDLLTALRDKAEVSHYLFEEKRAFDPKILARKFVQSNMSALEQRSELQCLLQNNSLCAKTYQNSLTNFMKEVADAIIALLSPPVQRAPEFVNSSQPRRSSLPLGKK